MVISTRSRLKRRQPFLQLRSLIVVGVVGAAAVVGYALGPVDQETFVHSYRPTSDGDNDLVVAPLALARSKAEALRLSIPCDVAGSEFRSLNQGIWESPDPAFDAVQSPLLLPDLGDALRVSVGPTSVRVDLGEKEILRAPLEPTAGCRADVEYRDGVWRLAVEGEESSVQADGPRFGEAVFSGPAAASPASEVVVETRELGSSPSALQLVFLLLMVLALVVGAREIIVRTTVVKRDRSSRDGDRPLKRLWGSIHLVDVAVFLSLVAWLFVLPPLADEGWIVAIQGEYDTHGDFSTLYRSGAATSPLGYWLLWLGHQWVGVSATPLIMRLPMLLIGLGTWAGLRSVARSFRIPGRGGSLSLMGAVFVVGYGAWGMTLRSEPIIAALLVLSLVLAIRFARGERGWVLIAWIAVLALGLTAHPAGVVVLAPAVALWRHIWEWVRSSREAAAIGLTSLMMLGGAALMLVVFDSNLAAKLDSFRAFSAESVHARSIFDEPLRYGALNGTHATAMRRAAVVLMLAPVGAFLVRRRRWRDIADLPARSLVAGLALLALTPSKWMWHFGGLIALAALVAAVELRRVRRDRTIAVMLGMALAMSWVWSGAAVWAPFDLRTQEWWRGARNLLPFDLSTPVAWVGIALVVGGVIAAYRRWWRRVSPSTWSSPEALAILSAGLVISITASTFVIDVIRTDGWTFGRQNIDAVFGRSGCGLGDEISVPVSGSLRVLPAAGEEAFEEADRLANSEGFEQRGGFEPGGFPEFGVNIVVPIAGMQQVGSWTGSRALPGENVGSYRSEWRVLDPGDDVVALMVMGALGEASENSVAVQWGQAKDSGVADLRIERVDLRGYYTDWALAEFEVPPTADRVRLLARDASTTGTSAWVASSLPLGMSVAPLSTVVATGSVEAMVTPSLIQYLPCVDVPPFESGVVRPPGVMVLTPGSLWQTTYLSAAVSDRFFRVPVVIPPNQDGNGIVLVVSQEHLTGDPARANGEFVRVGG